MENLTVASFFFQEVPLWLWFLDEIRGHIETLKVFETHSTIYKIIIYIYTYICVETHRRLDPGSLLT